MLFLHYLDYWWLVKRRRSCSDGSSDSHGGRACMYARTHVRAQARMYARTHACTRARTHARTRARTHARTHARTRARARVHARKLQFKMSSKYKNLNSIYNKLDLYLFIYIYGSHWTPKKYIVPIPVR